MLTGRGGGAESAYNASEDNDARRGKRGNSLGVKHPDAVVVRRSRVGEDNRLDIASTTRAAEIGSEEATEGQQSDEERGRPRMDKNASTHAEDDDVVDEEDEPVVVLRSCLVLRDADARKRWDRKDKEMQLEHEEAKRRRKCRRTQDHAASPTATASQVGVGKTRRGSWSSSSMSAVGEPLTQLSTSPTTGSVGGGLFRGFPSFRRSRSGSVGSAGSDRGEATPYAPQTLSSPIEISNTRATSKPGLLSTSPTSDMDNHDHARSDSSTHNFGGLSVSPVASTPRRFGLVRRRSSPVVTSPSSVISAAQPTPASPISSNADSSTSQPPRRIIERVRHPGCIEEDEEDGEDARLVTTPKTTSTAREVIKPASIPLRPCCSKCFDAVEKGLSPDWKSPLSASARRKLARQVAATQGSWTKTGDLGGGGRDDNNGNDHLHPESIVAVDEVEMPTSSPAKKKYDDA